MSVDAAASATTELKNLKIENGDAPHQAPSPVNTPASSATPEPGANGSTTTFKDQFKAFSKFGDSKSDGKMITLSQSDKWMKQAKVIDKQITTTDTGIYFKKLKSMKLNISDYNKFLEDLATHKKVELTQIKQKLTNCGQPGFHGAVGVSVYTLFGKHCRYYC